MKTAENTIFESGKFALDFDTDNNAKFTGIFDGAVRYICENQLYDISLWRKFAYQYSFSSDNGGYWKCEYWGKMMRGACFICNYTKDERLYNILKDSVIDLLRYQDEHGRFSTYSTDQEFTGWDVWGRKYVMLGMFCFYEICDDDELRDKIKTAMRRHADYIVSKLGNKEGQILVRDSSTAWLGANAMSILEPFVKLYNLTKEQKYLDFAAEIVREGYETETCIFKCAEENKLRLCDYPENKAYETMSCFEGLAEYYCVTGEQHYKKAFVNFGERLIEEEITIIGCCGCTHEIFDNSVKTQVNDKYDGIMQETCVSVTLIKTLGMLLRITGNVKYADFIERTFFNAYLGSLNTHHCVYVIPKTESRPTISGVMPFDSYSPLRSNARGKVTGGCNIMSDGTFYGCCACIGSLGAGYIPRIAVMTYDRGILLNMYLPGYISVHSPSGQRIGFDIKGNYPYESAVRITVSAERAEVFALDLRIPRWSRKTTVAVNGKSEQARSGRYSMEREWKNGDVIEIDFSVEVTAELPEKECNTAYVAYRYGCVVLAVDERMGVDASKPIRPLVNPDGTVEASLYTCAEAADNVLCFEVKTKDGAIKLIDYSSAGKDYGKEMAAWLPIAKQ